MVISTSDFKLGGNFHCEVRNTWYTF